MKTTKFFALIMIVLSILSHFGHSQLASGKSKFFGNIIGNYIPANYKTYWNQITL